MEDSATGKLSIKAGKVAFGSSVAELLQQISEQLQEQITLFNQAALHVHESGNLGYPTAPPSGPFAAAWTAAVTKTTLIKGLIDGIKGSL